MLLSQLAETITTSPLLIFAAKVNAQIAEGASIHNLTIGDFNPSLYPIPDGLTAAIIEAYQDKRTNYPGAHAVPPLLTAIQQLHQQQVGDTVELGNIQVASGSRPLIYAMFKTVLDAGDTVIYPVPSWNNETYTQLTEAKEVMIKTKAEHDFMPTAASIAPHIESAHLLALCSPQNPTGTIFGRDELTRIGQMIVTENKRRGDTEKPLYVMFDQVYSLLVHDQEGFVHPLSVVPELADYAVFIDGVSKNLAGTGVRVGWATGPADVIGKMRAFIAHIGAWAPTPEQWAVGQFLQDSVSLDAYLTDMNQRLSDCLEGLHNGIQALKAQGLNVDSISPKASIYLSVKIDIAGTITPEGVRLDGIDAIQEYLLNYAKLAVLPFSWFGATEYPQWFRISVGVFDPNDSKALLESLANALTQLAKEQ